jgi:hypothetical protein
MFNVPLGPKDDQVLAYDEVAVGLYWKDDESGSGTSIILDLADDGTNESTALAEIAVTNDTRSAFTEPSADKLLIDLDLIGPRFVGVDDKAARTMVWSCEFTTDFCSPSSTSLSTGTSTSGTVAPWAQAAADTEIYDFSTWPGWALVQINDGASDTNLRYWLPSTLASDTTWTLVARMSVTAGVGSGYAADEYTIGIAVRNASDTNEFVAIYPCEVDSGTNCETQLSVSNNGTVAVSTLSAPASGFSHAAGLIYVLWRNGNVYTAAVYGIGGGVSLVGSGTKTGETSMERLELILGASNNNITPVTGIDYIRIYDSLIVPPME